MSDEQVKDNQTSDNAESVMKEQRYTPALIEEARSVRIMMWSSLVLAILTVISFIFSFWFLPAPCLTGIIFLILNHFAIPRSERLLRSCNLEEVCYEAHRAYSLNVWLILWSVVTAVGLVLIWILVGFLVLLVSLPFSLWISIRMLFIWLKVENALEEIQENL